MVLAVFEIEIRYDKSEGTLKRCLCIGSVSYLHRAVRLLIICGCAEHGTFAAYASSTGTNFMQEWEQAAERATGATTFNIAL